MYTIEPRHSAWVDFFSTLSILQVFGAMLSSTLHVSASFYGTGESYLFTFFPFFKVCFHFQVLTETLSSVYSKLITAYVVCTDVHCVHPNCYSASPNYISTLSFLVVRLIIIVIMITILLSSTANNNNDDNNDDDNYLHGWISGLWISVALQQFNSVLLHDGFVDWPDYQTCFCNCNLWTTRGFPLVEK